MFDKKNPVQRSPLKPQMAMAQQRSFLSAIRGPDILLLGLLELTNFWSWCRKLTVTFSFYSILYDTHMTGHSCLSGGLIKLAPSDLRR